MNKLATFALATSMAVSSIAQQTAPSMVLTLKNGTVLEYELSDVEHITFRTGNDDQTLPANPVNIDVTRINTTSIMAKFSADDDEFTYVFGLTTKAEFDNIGNDDDFLAHDLNSLKQQAADYGMSFSAYLDFMIGWWEPDEQLLNRDNLTPDTDYYIYVYGLNTKGEITTVLKKQLVHTNALLNIAFNLSTTDLTSTTATINAAPDNTDTYYYLGFITKNEFENEFNGDEDYVINNALASVRMAIGYDGNRLGEVATVRKGNGVQKLAGLTPDMEYYALAFTIDETVCASSKLTKALFKTTPVAITDDCTFEINTTSVNPMLINLSVNPSSATTRYFVTIRNSADVASLTPGQVADSEVAFQNGFNPPINWSTDPRIFTGENTLNSRKDLGVTIIRPETAFTAYVFGVSEQGVRTTEVATLNITTPAATASSMTLAIKDVTADGENDPNDFAGWGPKICYFSYGITPSVDDEYYYTGVAKKSDYEAFANDEAFMDEAIKRAGDLIMMNCFMGENNSTLSTPTLFKTTADFAGASIVKDEEYIIFTFGYAGKATTPLFKYEVTASDGTSSGGGWDPWGDGSGDNGGDSGWATDW